VHYDTWFHSIIPLYFLSFYMVSELSWGSKENRPYWGQSIGDLLSPVDLYTRHTFSGKLLSYVFAFWETFMVVTFILATCFRFATTLFSFPEKCSGHHRLPSLFRWPTVPMDLSARLPSSNEPFMLFRQHINLFWQLPSATVSATFLIGDYTIGLAFCGSTQIGYHVGVGALTCGPFDEPNSTFCWCVAARAPSFPATLPAMISLLKCNRTPESRLGLRILAGPHLQAWCCLFMFLFCLQELFGLCLTVTVFHSSWHLLVLWGF